MSGSAFTPENSIRAAIAEDEASIMTLLPYLADFEIPPRRQPEHLWSGDAAMAREILAGTLTSSFIDVATDLDEQISGFIMVSLRQELLSHAPSAHLEAIVVAPHARGTGLGKRLMQHCEHRVTALGACSLTLHVFARNARARALYAAQEFDEELIRAIKWLN
ncbi:MAG: GNAT family N-acetyltransferase [Proteobacteria bacterium]|nr:GNAT family N-acetyltransferase [Pseudomonadota bacterium]